MAKYQSKHTGAQIDSGIDKVSILEIQANSMNERISTIENSMITDVYTKEESDAKYTLKDNVYTKEEADLKYVLKDETYTKEEADAKYATNETVGELEGDIQELGNRIDNIQPSETVDAYTKEESDSRYASKATENQTNTNTNNIADLTTKVTNIESSYIKSVAYEPIAGIFTFTLQDGSIRTVDLAIEKVVTNFEYIEDSAVPTDLTGYTVTVPVGWIAEAGYGMFDVCDDVDFPILAIGYTKDRWSLTEAENSITRCYSEESIGAEIEDATDNTQAITFIAGADKQDVTSQQLIQWLVSNKATFTKDGVVPTGEAGLKLTLADGTSQFIPLAEFIKDYTGKDGDQIQINIVNHEVSAILKDGSIKINHLDSKFANDVNAVFTAIGELLNDVQDNTEAIADRYTKQETGDLIDAKIEDAKEELKNIYLTKSNDTVIDDGQIVVVNADGSTSYSTETLYEITNRISSLEQNQGSGSSFGGTVFETQQIIIEVSDWTELPDSEPYKYFANVTLSKSLDNAISVELINNNPILFAKYGFAIGEVTAMDELEIYSIGQPNDSVILTLEVISQQVSLITFILDGVGYNGRNYEAEEGMTWEEWINSDYNVDNFIIKDTYILAIDTTSLTDYLSYEENYSRWVLKTDVITPITYFVDRYEHGLGGGAGEE